MTQTMDKRAAASDDEEEFLSDEDAAGDDKSEFSVSEDEDGEPVQSTLITAGCWPATIQLCQRRSLGLHQNAQILLCRCEDGREVGELQNCGGDTGLRCAGW